MRIKTRSEDSLSVTEKFLYKLVQIPHYDLRIRIMLSRATSPPQLRELLDRLREYRDACRYLLDNESIKVFLCWVLQAVNDINNVGSACLPSWPLLLLCVWWWWRE